MSKTPRSIHAAYQSLLSTGRLHPNPHQTALVSRLDLLQQTLVNDNGPQPGLYIHGAVGTGKSRLADLFASTLSPSISHRRVHFHAFMLDIHSRLHLARSQPSYSGDPLVAIGQQIHSESRVLCFDEFQVTDIADAMILKRLFGAVWAEGGVIVATSNRHPTRLYERGLNRALFVPFIEELQRRSEVWEMGGGRDYRLVAVDNEERMTVPVFFTSEPDFDDAIHLATNSAPLTSASIPVMMNRSLAVEAHTPTKPSRLIVKASFASLFTRPLGSADYHALCHHASTVYVDGLRPFKSDELDFLRRFIMLIDIAYEAGTRVVCLSSHPLDEIFAEIMVSDDSPNIDVEMRVMREGGSSSSMMSTFIGGTEWSATGLAKASLASGGAGETDVRFAVARTVSRLSEMGWATYGLKDED